MRIADINPDFKGSPIADCQVEFFHAYNPEKFGMTGVFYEPERQAYCRVNRDVIEEIDEENITYLSYCTSGGELRFTSNSPVIVLRAKLLYEEDFPHMPRTGVSGFDLFIDNEFKGNLNPAKARELVVEGIWSNKYGVLFTGLNEEARTLNYSLLMPLYNGVASFEVGIIEGCSIEPVKDPRKRVVFYGSSITQGGCSSRPGNSYGAMICRQQGLEQVNLGFSGVSKGRQPMARYIASLRPDLLVMDYDYNASTVEVLRNTHEPFFKTFREANPSAPVIFISKPNGIESRTMGTTSDRKAVILDTYNNALDAGDQNVYFIDGENIMGQFDPSACTVDMVHPNDLGFSRMAEIIGKVVSEALG